MGEKALKVAKFLRENPGVSLSKAREQRRRQQETSLQNKMEPKAKQVAARK